MRWLQARLVMIMTVVFVALAVGQFESSTAIAATIVGLAVVAALGARYAAVVIHSREITVGRRAHEHRESLVEVAAPRYPSTPGRPRTRAPALGLQAA